MTQPSAVSDDSLSIEVDRQAPSAVVRLSGSVTMETDARLNEALQSLVRDGFTRIVLDLARLAFICSGGLGTLVAAHVRCLRSDGQVTVVAPQPRVRDVLNKTKLDHLFPIRDSVAQALPA